MRPLPEITTENRSFWTGGARSELMIAFCSDCAAAIHPPQVVCPQCQSCDVEARAVAGSGTIFTFTINHQQWLPGMEVPFGIAVVDVDGAPGVRVTAMVNCDNPDALAIGQRVAIGFQQVDTVWIPHWNIAATGVTQ